MVELSKIKVIAYVEDDELLVNEFLKMGWTLLALGYVSGAYQHRVDGEDFQYSNPHAQFGHTDPCPTYPEKYPEKYRICGA